MQLSVKWFCSNPIKYLEKEKGKDPMGSILVLTVTFSQNLVKLYIDSFRKGPGGITDNSDGVPLCF